MDFAKGIKPLNGAEDWPMWKDRVMDVLELFNALDIVQGKRKEPVLTDNSTQAEKEAFNSFQKSSSQAKIVISQSVSDEIHHRISGRLSAKEAWDILVQQFDNTAEDQLFRQCLDFFNTEWAESEDAPTVLSRIKNQYRDFSAGLKTREITTVDALLELLFISKVLHILPKRLDSFKSGYLLMKANSTKTVEDLTAALILHERNVAPTQKQPGEAFMITKNKHKVKNVKKNKKDDICKYCSEKGHWLLQCQQWKKDGKPPYPARAVNTNDNKELRNGSVGGSSSSQAAISETRVALVSISSDVNLTNNANDNWWIDNGATRHITSNFRWFKDFQPFNRKSQVKAAGNELLEACGSGTIEIVNYENHKLNSLTLKDVWYVPGITKNLFSVLAAHDRNPGSRFQSNDTKCQFIIDKQVVVEGVRQPNGSLYKATFHVNQPDEICVNVVEHEKSLLQLYHERWGHQDKRYVLSKLESELGIKTKYDSTICEPCLFGKFHRKSFGKRPSSTSAGELLSGDVCGPFDDSFSGRKYLIVIKDHYSKYRYCFVARHKSAVQDALKEVLAKAHTLGHRIKEFMSDNGGEFDNDDVRSLLKRYGVTQRFSAPYTPQQNGMVERDNRTIVEMARVFKYSNNDIKYPAAIWAELVVAAGYVLNRTGKSSVPNKSPHEIWIGQIPRIKHLRIIGSKCYVHIPAQTRRKMDSKAIVGYLVGYDGDERYRIYVPGRRDIYVSRDVVFDEKLKDCESTSWSIKEGEEISDTPVDTVAEPVKALDQTDQLPSEDESEFGHESTSTNESRYNLRQSNERRLPSRLQDYVNVIEAFLTEVEPETYEEAIICPEKQNWKIAMDNEIKAMQTNDAWELTELPHRQRPLNSKWVYRLKRNPDGSIDKYRARLVIKGYAQRPGIDYSETFSPVTRLATVRSLLAIAATERMVLKQFDVSTAFLYGDIEEIIFMNQPEGYEDGTKRVCRLKRSLYGLKQAPRCWYRKFDDFMVSLGFRTSNEDPCVYIRRRKTEKIIIALYVDDGLIAATNRSDLNHFIEELQSRFKIVVKGATFFLGFEINQKPDGDITVSQIAFIKRIISRFNMNGCNPVLTPMEKLTSTEIGKVDTVTFPYRSAVGALLYLAMGTRPDITFSISVLSRSLENPSSADVARLKRVIRYLSGTLNLHLIYRNNSTLRQLECFSDADFAGCSSTSRSTSGVLIKYAGAAITWLSRRQSLVSDSTCEAEIVAANLASKEIIWIQRLFQELVGLTEIPILQIDNQAAIRIAENPELHQRTKHIQRKHLFIRDRIKHGMLNVSHVDTTNQLADIFTKPLARPRLQQLRKLLGLMDTFPTRESVKCS